MTVIHNKSKSDYLNKLNKKNIQSPDLSKIPAQKTETQKTEIATSNPTPENTVAKPTSTNDKPHSLDTALEGAKEVAEVLASSPVLPIGIPAGASLKKDGSPKIKDVKNEIKNIKKLDKPALIFIEGFELFSSGGNGIKDMADAFNAHSNLKAKHFSWRDKDGILSEIKRHQDKQPVVLVGHSFGADTAVEIANELNDLSHGYRPIDLLITLDAVGFNHHVIPVNVKRNLNLFAEGRVPMLHGTAHVAKNPKLTEIHNELKSETHREIDDSRDIQFEIFNEIKSLLNDKLSSIAESDTSLALGSPAVASTINIIVLDES